jgi:hypothetical protein
VRALCAAFRVNARISAIARPPKLFTVTNVEYIRTMEPNIGAISDEPRHCGGMKHLPPADLVDPVIEEYKKHLDVTLIIENLKRTPHERVMRMAAIIERERQMQETATGGRNPNMSGEKKRARKNK